ncbi:hypothetical protein ACFWAP_33610 [Streptomyces goshikiensis]|uniref:hypothetical protein n=1 Tax=Streptomyces goshikiensis TaxID=1942 RepID=UPI0036532AE7
MLQIRVAAQSPTEGANDVLCRAVRGWAPGMTEDQVWAVNRGVWSLRVDHALAEAEVQIVNLDGTVVAVARVTGVTEFVVEGRTRYAVEGDLLRGDPRVGRSTPWPHPSRNPIAYVGERADLPARAKVAPAPTVTAEERQGLRVIRDTFVKRQGLKGRDGWKYVTSVRGINLDTRLGDRLIGQGWAEVNDSTTLTSGQRVALTATGRHILAD